MERQFEKIAFRGSPEIEERFDIFESKEIFQFPCREQDVPVMKCVFEVFLSSAPHDRFVGLFFFRNSGLVHSARTVRNIALTHFSHRIYEVYFVRLERYFEQNAFRGSSEIEERSDFVRV